VKAKAAERIALATDPAAVRVIKLMHEAESEAVQYAAANSILDRGLGKPRQSVDVEVQKSWDDSFEGVVWAAGEVAESEPSELEVENARLRARVAALEAGQPARPELPATRQVDDRPSGPLEGRVLDDDEPWPPRLR
jgi:hypothetical protein